MLINVSVQCNGGLLPDIIVLLTLYTVLRNITSNHTCAVYWSCAGGLSAVNAIGTQLRDLINSGLTRWRMVV